MDPPSLKELALQQCMRISGYLEDIGNVRYELIEPALSRLNSRQLKALEDQAPHIRDKSDKLWKPLIEKDFSDSPVPYDDFRNNYFILQAEKHRHLGAARERLLRNQKQAARARAHSSIVMTEQPVRMPGSTPWRSSTMQQLAKQSSLASRGRQFPRAAAGAPSPSPPLWSPAHSPTQGSPTQGSPTQGSPTQGSPSPPSLQCAPTGNPKKRTLGRHPPEPERKRDAKGGIFIKR